MFVSSQEITRSSRSLSSSDSSVVSFGDIQVREFERIAGDHPDVSDLAGPPLSIGWGFLEKDSVPVDDYEMRRQRCDSKDLQPLDGKTRRKILEEGFAVPAEEMKMIIREVSRTQRRRFETKNQGKFGEYMELMAESAARKARKMKRVFSK